jgi:hypothetical protein
MAFQLPDDFHEVCSNNARTLGGSGGPEDVGGQSVGTVDDRLTSGSSSATERHLGLVLAEELQMACSRTSAHNQNEAVRPHSHLLGSSSARVGYRPQRHQS